MSSRYYDYDKVKGECSQCDKYRTQIECFYNGMYWVCIAKYLPDGKNVDPQYEGIVNKYNEGWYIRSEKYYASDDWLKTRVK